MRFVLSTAVGICSKLASSCPRLYCELSMACRSLALGVGSVVRFACTHAIRVPRKQRAEQAINKRMTPRFFFTRHHRHRQIGLEHRVLSRLVAFCVEACQILRRRGSSDLHHRGSLWQTPRLCVAALRGKFHMSLDHGSCVYRSSSFGGRGISSGSAWHKQALSCMRLNVGSPAQQVPLLEYP